MSYSSILSDVTKSSIKSSASILSTDSNEQSETQQQPQKQAQQPMESPYEGSAMQFAKMDTFVGSNGMSSRRVSRRGSVPVHGRRSGTARKRAQNVYKSSSFPILANPYLNFLRDYRMHYADRYQGNELVQRAANKWRGMTPKQRLLYEPQAYQLGKFTALVENSGLIKMKSSGVKFMEDANDAQEDACRPGIACPPRSPPKRSCRPKMAACKKKKPACRTARRKMACKPRKPACRRPKKACRPKKKACKPKKRACKPRKPACRPKKAMCKPKKPNCAS